VVLRSEARSVDELVQALREAAARTPPAHDPDGLLGRGGLTSFGRGDDVLLVQAL
jgi:hypothetical protein